MTKKPRWIWVVAASLFAALWLGLLVTAPDFRACVADETQARASATQHEPPPPQYAIAFAGIRCALFGAYAYKDGILAIATILLAVFTYKLWTGTNDTLAHLQESSQRELRAYVFPHTKSRTIAGDETTTLGPTILLEIKNSGRTPAFRVGSLAEQQVAPYPLQTPLRPIPSIPHGSLSFIAPGGTMHMRPPRFHVSPSDRLLLDTGGHFLYLSGIVTYEDAFKRLRTTKFCYRIVDRGLAFYAGGNEAD